MNHLTLYSDMVDGATKEEVQEFETKIMKDFGLTEEELTNLLENLDLNILNLNIAHIFTMLDYYNFDSMQKLKEIWLFDMYNKYTYTNPDIEQITNPFLKDYLKSDCCLNLDWSCLSKLIHPRDIYCPHRSYDAQMYDIVKLSHKYCIKFLLSKIHDSYTLNTLLFMSCKHNNYNIVETLLEKNIDLEIQNNDKETPFFVACLHGHTEIVKLLLTKDIEINMKNSYGRTVLVEACYRNHVEVLKLLLKSGIVSDQKLEEKIFSDMCRHGFIEIANLLLERCDNVDAKDFNGDTPFYLCCAGNYIEIVKLLLDKGVDINAKDSNGTTPILIACHNGHVEIAKMLLDKDADIELKDASNSTPLLWACYHGHLEIVNMLLDKNAEINGRNMFRGGETPLIAACRNGHLEIVTRLLEKNAEINITNDYGETPLVIAHRNHNMGIVKILLEKSAEMNVKSPFLLGFEKYYTRFVKYYTRF